MNLNKIYLKLFIILFFGSASLSFSMVYMEEFFNSTFPVDHRNKNSGNENEGKKVSVGKAEKSFFVRETESGDLVLPGREEVEGLFKKMGLEHFIKKHDLIKIFSLAGGNEKSPVGLINIFMLALRKEHNPEIYPEALDQAFYEIFKDAPKARQRAMKMRDEIRAKDKTGDYDDKELKAKVNEKLYFWRYLIR